MSPTLTIDRLGAQGDGVAETAAGPVYVPFTLPGERVNAAIAKGRGEMIALLDASPERVEPACRHFGVCGSCSLQHLKPAAYRAWKRGKLVEALHGKGIEVLVDDIVACEPGTRRRVVFSARRTERGMLLGYMKALSHEIVDIVENPIARPEIVAALPLLRELAGVICATPKPFRLAVTHTASGLDIAAAESGKLSGQERQAAVDFVVRSGIARLSIDGEIIVEPMKPVVMAGDVAVNPPPGAFLQAVESAEEAMAGLVCGHLAKSKRVLDLFAGIGTFALRLARAGEVHAVEGDGAALASLDRAARFGERLRKVTIERRDLFIRPLTFKELDAFDGLVFDPPRAGAEDQAKQIARSTVRRVAAVSCNPTTLARDLRILIDGGYVLKRVVPIDQFLWSPHLEAVALLEKPPRRR